MSWEVLPNVRSNLQVSAQRPAKRPVKLLLGPSVQNIFYNQKGRQQHGKTKCRKLQATQIYNAQENREFFILLLVTSLLEEGTQACFSYLWRKAITKVIQNWDILICARQAKYA